MTRDYKPVLRKQKTSGKGSVFFTGFLFGLVVGVAASVAVAWFIKGGDSAFSSPESAPRIDAAPAAPDASETGAAGLDDTSRFDFYKILPGSESQSTEQEVQRNEVAPPQNYSSEKYYLQVGAFQTEQEADNLKAQLALLGLEALVQTAEVPEKGVWHRVRVGPYGKLEQITRVRSTLTQNGFNSELVKVHSNQPDQ